MLGGCFNACIGLAEGYDPVGLIGVCGMGARNERGNMLMHFVLGTWLSNSQSEDARVPNS